MAPKGQKRSALDAKKTSKKTKVECDGIHDDPTMTSINAVILEDEILTLNCKNMLIAGVRGSLTVPVDDRHEAQKLVVGMVNEVMDTKQTILQKLLDVAKAEEVAISASKEELAAKLVLAEAALVEKASIVAEAAKANDAAAEALAHAKAMLAEKEEQQRTADAAMDVLRQDKAEIETAMEQTLKTIAEGESNVGQLVCMLQRLNFDESLIVALPGTCARAPSDRGAFDSMVLNQLETGLRGALQEMTTKLESEGLGVQARAKAVEEALVTLQTAEDGKASAANALTQSESPRIEAFAAVETAKEALLGQGPKQTAAETLRAEKARALEEFITNVRTPFVILRDATSDKAPSATNFPEESAPVAAPEVEIPTEMAASYIDATKHIAAEMVAPVEIAGA